MLDRDGQQRSATQARNQALGDSDHLALLHAIWTDQTTPARDRRYRDLLLSILPPADRREPSHRRSSSTLPTATPALRPQTDGQLACAGPGDDRRALRHCRR